MPVMFSHHPNAQATFQPPLIANGNAYLGDIFSSDKDNTEKPMSAGFFRLEKGTPLVHQYIYDEMKLVTEGEFEISDETGQKVKAKPGDVFYFPHGTKATYMTESYGVEFYICSFSSLIYRVVADRKRLFNDRARYNKQL